MIAAIWKSAVRTYRIRDARVRMLEAAGDELARNADYWQARAVAAEHERDELATCVRLYELAEEDAVTQVDQSNAIAVLQAELADMRARYHEATKELHVALDRIAHRDAYVPNAARNALDKLQLPPPSMEGL